MTLASLHQEGHAVRVIARLLGRSPSTIGRELARNRSACDYSSVATQKLCQQRRIEARPVPRLHAAGTLWRVVCDLLSWCWSPSRDQPRSVMIH